jgi:plastocyanin
MPSPLEHMDTQNLRDLWLETFGVQPAPRLSKNLMVRLLTFQQQGGLNKVTNRKLQNCKKQVAGKGKVFARDAIRIKPGTKLIREWKGKTHAVLRTENGFEYEGEIYSSLSTIAKLITGSHWSGPRFFGLNKRPTPPRVSS